MVALPDSLFIRALAVGKEDKQILDGQKGDRNTWEEWKCLHKCEERDGVLYRGEALAVMCRGEIYRDLLKKYHDETTARHLGVWKTWQAL